MAWTKKDRVLAVFNGELPDRVPLFEALFNDEILEHFGGSPIPVGNEQAIVQACSHCLDISHPINGRPFEPGEIILPDGTRQINERWSIWTIPPKGRDIHKIVMQEIDEFEQYEPCDEEVMKWKNRAVQINRCCGEMVPILLGVELAVLPGTLEEGFYFNADSPELARRWNRAKNAKLLRWMGAAADPSDSPVAIIWNDLGIKGRLLFPKHMLEEIYFPVLKEACGLLHEKGMKVLFHCDGYVAEIMEMLVDCGIDGFNPLEISAGMEVRWFKENYGNRIPLVGGLDAVEVLARGTVDKVVNETRRLIDVAGKGGGLIAGSTSGEIDNSMPVENVLAYFETVWEYGRY